MNGRENSGDTDDSIYKANITQKNPSKRESLHNSSKKLNLTYNHFRGRTFVPMLLAVLSPPTAKRLQNFVNSNEHRMMNNLHAIPGPLASSFAKFHALERILFEL